MSTNERTNIQVGDKVICITEKGFYRAWNAFVKPKLDAVYEVVEICENYLVLKGFDKDDLWHKRNFMRLKRLSELLAEDLIKSTVDERSDSDRVFRTDAKF
jgi:hypothetical protein